jgi:ribosomal protein S18 acetylase RimI-like enzyme
MLGVRRQRKMKDTSPNLRPAQLKDISRITEIVNAAYAPYTARIGKPPGPMLADYSTLIQEGHVTVAEIDKTIIGIIVLVNGKDGPTLDNVAVDPAFQGKGFGKFLIKYAENEMIRLGRKAMYLYTNEKMTENISMYYNLGYVVIERRYENGYSRVYMKKQLTIN